MNKQAVFVGGCADGKRVDLDVNIPYYKMPFYTWKPFSWDDAAFESVSQLESHNYKRFPLHCGKDDFFIFIWEELTPSEAMQKLITGYSSTLPTKERY